LKELTVEAKTGNIDAVTDFLNAELEGMGCPAKARIQIDVAVDEIFSNIASYAYAPGVGSATVRVEAKAEPRAAVITFLDSGTPYDPLQNEDPDVTLPAEDRSVGGLGVFLVKRTMDDVHYEYSDGKNILRITKRF
jgi:Anti-sigma regulatory factor (Ser/Thr protein kinase)